MEGKTRVPLTNNQLTICRRSFLREAGDVELLVGKMCKVVVVDDGRLLKLKGRRLGIYGMDWDFGGVKHGRMDTYHHTLIL